MSEPEKAYCIACGEIVPLEKVNLGIQGEDLFRCAQCGAYLGTAKSVEQMAQSLEKAEALTPPPILREQPAAPAEFDPETSLLSSGPIPEVPRSRQASELAAAASDETFELGEKDEAEAAPDCIILAEDSELTRSILKDMITRRGLSRRVISCSNGFEFVINYIKSRNDKLPIKLIILDVVMPVLNGISAAVASRAWEKTQGIDPIPLLYFTSKRCDETFKRVIQHTRPAMYINKGSSDSAVQLEIRIEKLINQMLKENL